MRELKIGEIYLCSILEMTPVKLIRFTKSIANKDYCFIERLFDGSKIWTCAEYLLPTIKEKLDRILNEI